MMGLVSERGSSSSAGEGSLRPGNERELELAEQFNSPDSTKFFEYIERLMADDEDRILNSNEWGMKALNRTPEDINKFYQVDDEDVNDKAVEESTLLQRNVKEVQEVPMETPRRRRFFGIYERVKVNLLWKRLMELGVVSRSKRLRLMDISATTSVELNYGQEV